MNILFSPLDWGLGHAVRDVPIIRYYTEKKHSIFIAASEPSLTLLKKEFPDATFIKINAYNIQYSKYLPAILKITVQIPKIIIAAIREHFLLNKIIEKHKIDIVFSDNRYGMYSKKTKSIFITHQISIKLPKLLSFAEKIIYIIHKKAISKFDKCLIPDYEGENNLSGNLSHKYPKPKNAIFIEPLSDFKIQQKKENFKYDIMAIISGPEPQRSIFEKKILEEFTKLNLKSLVITGKPHIENFSEYENITIINHLPRAEMLNAILNSETIISRAGYTSIMDFYRLRKKAILIPTPGQTEQEYLAEYLYEKNFFLMQSQNKLDLEKIYKKNKIFKMQTKTVENSNKFYYELEQIIKI